MTNVADLFCECPCSWEVDIGHNCSTIAVKQVYETALLPSVWVSYCQPCFDEVIGLAVSSGPTQVRSLP